MKNPVVIRVQDPVIQRHRLNKLIGTIPLESFASLITHADLDANPRIAKKSKVTDDIEESLETDADIFEFKTKGVLVAAAMVEELERNRFRLTFEEPQLEGILDGGHNTLAIGRHILRRVLTEHFDDEAAADAVVHRVRRWEDLRAVWDEHANVVHDHKKELGVAAVPAEIIFPSEDVDGLQVFRDKILSINAARNNNAALKEEAKAFKKGVYDPIKDRLDPEVQKQVEWKTNEGGRLKSRELVALSLIPLSKLYFESLNSVRKNPTVLFSSKGQCVEIYNNLTKEEGVARKQQASGEVLEIIDPGVLSALDRMAEFPRLFDLIYQRIPRACNDVSPGFGRIRTVSVFDPNKYVRGAKDQRYLRSRPKTHFYQQEVDYKFGDGWVYPFLWGLSAILEIRDGKVEWKTDPEEFIEEHLTTVMEVVYSFMKAFAFDPAKFGKDNGVYGAAFQFFEKAYTDSQAA